MASSDDRAAFARAAPLTELHRQWRWLLALGVLLAAIGIAAIVDSVAATVLSTLFVGWILVFAGVVEAVQSARHVGHGHLFLHVLNAVLSIVVGGILLWNPLVSAIVITLLMAIYFAVAGVFRLVTAISLPVPGRGWLAVDGVATLVLGILVWSQWPASGLWVVGLFIGIDLVIVGWAQVMLALALRPAASA